MTFYGEESDDMLMDKARATFKRENKKKPFTLEYVWKILRKEPKWYRSILTVRLNGRLARLNTV